MAGRRGGAATYDRAMRLSPEEGRVIGSLIEKQLATPQQYPLTLNALVLACNQSTNRDPVVSYSDSEVHQTLVGLKDAGLVRFVHPSHGRSVIRYRQVLDERLGLDNGDLALMAVLLLRGPQTAAELRARTERMAVFEGLAAVEAELQRLSGWEEPLVRRLPRRPGQKEERWCQALMSGPAPEAADAGPPASRELAEDGARGAGAAPAAPSSAPRPAASEAGGGVDGGPPASAGEIAALRAETAALRAEVAALREAVEHLRAELGV